MQHITHLNIQALHNLGMGQTYVQNDQNTMTKIQAAISGNTDLVRRDSGFGSLYMIRLQETLPKFGSQLTLK